MNIKPLEYIHALNAYSKTMDNMQNVFHPDNDVFYKPVMDILGVSRIYVSFTERGAKPQVGTICGKGQPIGGTVFRQTEKTQNGSIADYTLYKSADFPEWDDEDKEILSGFVKIMFAFNGRAEMITMAKKMMFVDWATEAGNLNAFFTTLNELISKNELGQYGTCRFNLTRFSTINKFYGRRIGTQVMRSYVMGIIDKVPGSSVFRVGGDNFTALFRKESFEDIKRYLKGTAVKVDMPDSPEVTISASAGFYLCNGTEANIDEIMLKISSGLSLSKTMTKDGIFVFNEEAKEKIEERKLIETQFWAAVENNEFEAYYQPKVNIITGRIAGVEALCRWIKDGKVIPPIDFIPVLEQSIAICKLDFYILDRTCKDIRKWLDKGNQAVKASVNFSRMHLGDERLLDKIIDIIDRNGVPHEHIEIELTETTTDVDFNELRQLVNGLHENSISTSVDDFGMGYSSLTLIKDLPWDILKIDKSFLPDGSENDEQKLIMLRHVVSMAQGLGLQCIIEGVETREQIELLKDINCLLAQGFYFDKPLPKAQFEEKLLQHYTI